MWNIIFWIFAVIGMITTLVIIIYLLGLIFSGRSCGYGSSSSKKWMEEYASEHCYQEN